jgi:hypothetical protein
LFQGYRRSIIPCSGRKASGSQPSGTARALLDDLPADLATVGLSTGISYIDNFRTPHSEKLHVVERFTLEPGGKGMSALVTVEDPDTFNAPLTMTRRWFKFDGPMLETICAENNVDFVNQNLFPQPEARTLDF